MAGQVFERQGIGHRHDTQGATKVGRIDPSDEATDALDWRHLVTMDSC